MVSKLLVMQGCEVRLEVSLPSGMKSATRDSKVECFTTSHGTD